MRTTALFAALLMAVTSLSITDADARRVRHRQPTVDRTPALAPVCRSGDQVIDCTTGNPITLVDSVPDPEDVVTPVSSTPPRPLPIGPTIKTLVLTSEQADVESRSPVPLNLSNITVEQFNDTRAMMVHDQVYGLIQDAMQHSDLTRVDDQSRHLELIHQIQFVLDPIADPNNSHRMHPRTIHHYWITSYADRTFVFVRPMTTFNIIRFEIPTP